jgi:hypothetical protein
MGPTAIIDLLEMIFGALSALGEHLKVSGVLPASHPLHAQLNQIGQAVADAKTAAAAQP